MASAPAEVQEGKRKQRRSRGGQPLADEADASGSYFVGACGFMGLPPKKYAGNFDVIELDFTFHDQSDATYQDQAEQYKALGIKVVVKVSRYATHIMGLANSREWWSWLKSKYKAFLDAGVLVGLLWQLPPSFSKSEDNLNSLGRLGAQLRNVRQGSRWQMMHHAFEFRDSSWYNAQDVTETMARHRLTLVTSHFINNTGWAGDLASGWHGPEASAANDFAYIRCLGTEGRSIGRYSLAELREIASKGKSCSAAVIVFGQGDAPPQAFENAKNLRVILDGQTELEDTSKDKQPLEMVSGTVVASITKGWNRHAILDVNGRKAYLGYRHLQKKGGVDLKVGTVLNNLHVEAEDAQCLYLSAAEIDLEPYRGVAYRLAAGAGGA
eukprot:TRINITY_DN75926_c0_g1_i1.p1 TRINITY_DN75926_c0_g1~~TRINITY_DN75926_c0_g1_i1.p1  ORF type:complete len:382 (+),score=77.99 TRINITY_DN75926_c0_g1_i1:65-1210(+)